MGGGDATDADGLLRHPRQLPGKLTRSQQNSKQTVYYGILDSYQARGGAAERRRRGDRGTEGQRKRVQEGGDSDGRLAEKLYF